ncbi:MAG: protein phosphatase 2C domain-containing protein [Pseudomonadota bacterium]
MSIKGKLEFAAETHVGQVRDHNEDYISCEGDLGIGVLADGMGGLNAGEVASSMSVHLLMDDLVSYREGTGQLIEEMKSTDDAENYKALPLESAVVKYAIEKANSMVFHTSQTQPQCRGMGTTVVVSLFWDNRVIVGHIGDSRLYRFRDDALEQVTRDHSFVQELLDKGLVSEEEARTSNRKNVVTRAVGVAPTVEAEVHEYDALPGDVYLLCSDGLSDLVIDQDIEKSGLAYRALADEEEFPLSPGRNLRGGGLQFGEIRD